ncbi:MAG: 4Fe-4S dicluster domain-containing protein [Candidatus Schekmanbacteria bacterium]|nr:4Fe-4S dicluster domain-containing protein [Candidatus Schekmanbacteria bacterium]
MADIERESLPVDVLFVGGGPASLAGALRLTQLVKAHNQAVERGDAPGEPLEPEIAVIEKGESPGACGLSGALLNPRALEELLPDYRNLGFPGKLQVHDDRMLVMTRRRAFPLPGIMHPAHNEGNWIISLQRFNDWLAKIVEDTGVYMLTDTCGVEVLYDDTDKIIGVRTGDKGLDKNSRPMANFTAGSLIESKVTLFGEGPRGTLTEDLKLKFHLERGNPQIYSIGVKEIIEVPNKPDHGGFAMHSLGWPVPYGVFGGGFLYELDEKRFSVGIVMSLDWKNPHLDAQKLLQHYKLHPAVNAYLRGGEVVSYGAKTIPEGGFYSLPELAVDGGLIIGDSAGFLSVVSLKGIHYAMKSGMVAAETVFESLKSNDFSSLALGAYRHKLDRTFVMQELYQERNFRVGFHKSFALGMVKAGVFLKVWSGPRQAHPIEADYRALAKLAPPNLPDLPRDNPLIIDKLTAVHLARTGHRDDQPSHIQILDPKACIEACIPAHGTAPCVNFCPAAVYEHVREEGNERIQVNFSNCVHCKTCTIKDPYDSSPGDLIQNINWRAPAEGGPRYQYL